MLSSIPFRQKPVKLMVIGVIVRADLLSASLCLAAYFYSDGIVTMDG